MGKKIPLLDKNCRITDINKEKEKFNTHICLRSEQHSYDDDEIISIPTVTQEDVKEQLLTGHLYMSKAG